MKKNGNQFVMLDLYYCNRKLKHLHNCMKTVQENTSEQTKASAIESLRGNTDSLTRIKRNSYRLMLQLTLCSIVARAIMLTRYLYVNKRADTITSWYKINPKFT